MDGTDEAWMRRAIDLAREGWGETHPNPLVGAVLADGARLLAEGHHARAGEAHAEVRALEGWRDPVPETATLYVTLEPCSSFGRTPPCTEAILRRGVKRVVTGATDDDPRHCGRGLDLLREAGVEVRTGLLEEECRDLNLIFHHAQATGRPLIAAKIATSIDGRIATAAGRSKWITGEESRRDVHRWRRYFPAIGVGAGTVLADDPSLTARGGAAESCPRRLVFDRSGILAGHPGCRVFTDAFAARTVVFADPDRAADLRRALPERVAVESLPGEGDWFAFLQGWLGREELPGLYLEGGSRLLSAFFSRGGVDYLFAYRAPRLFLDDQARPPASGRSTEDPADGLVLEQVRHASFGPDQLMRGFVVGPNHKI